MLSKFSWFLLLLTEFRYFSFPPPCLSETNLSITFSCTISLSTHKQISTFLQHFRAKYFFTSPLQVLFEFSLTVLGLSSNNLRGAEIHGFRQQAFIWIPITCSLCWGIPSWLRLTLKRCIVFRFYHYISNIGDTTTWSISVRAAAALFGKHSGYNLPTMMAKLQRSCNL